MVMTVLGVDVGTTVCKCRAVKGGKQVGFASRAYGLKDGKFASIDTNALVKAVFEVIAIAARDAGEISAVCVSSLGEAFIAVDESGKPLFETMLYTDTRGSEQAAKLRAKFGRGTVYDTGATADPMYSLCRLMWLCENEPEKYERVSAVMFVADYISYLLSGERAVDYSLASRSLMFDVFAEKWDERLVSEAGLSPNKLSKPVHAGSAIGFVKPEICAELNIKGKPAVVAGAHDQVASAIGAGLRGCGNGVVGLGTVECITPVFNGGIADLQTMADGAYAAVPYLNGTFVTYAFNFTAGALADWFKGNLARVPHGEEFHAYYEKNLPQNSGGVLCLPYFAGCATPYMDGAATGAFVGLTTVTDTFTLYRAVLEGTSFEMKYNLSRLREAGVKVNALTATGGGSRNRAWLKIKSDILGVPITPLKNSEAGVNGSCMLAAIAAGEYSGMDEASEDLCEYGETVEPDFKATENYLEAYSKYKKLYPLLKQLNL